ncbi:MAG TPA: DUF2189 domain-containing protein [Steroidobacter sp.]|jgi:uncharacterized membrane protein|nr:DUF2189 domain-containing protein [Steroidobacter sp.]
MNATTETNAPEPQQIKPEELPFAAPCRTVPPFAPFEWLRLGWKDLTAAPGQSLFYGVLLASLGAVLAFLTWRLGLAALYLGLASGFVFVGPFLAVGLYSISYQLEAGRQPTLSFSLHEGRAHLRDTLVLGLCLLVVLLVWARAATLMNVFRPSTGFPTLRELLPFLSIGAMVGAVFSAIVFAVTAFSLPMLLDRRADAVTAVLTSVNATLHNKAAMIIWGMLIVSAVLIGFATALVGFVLLLPWIGHATWHAYRSTIDASMWPTTHSEPNEVRPTTG